MTAKETALELARILLENEIRFLAHQKEMADALTRQDENAPAPSQDPAQGRGKGILIHDQPN
jgi:hypothetical protein